MKIKICGLRDPQNIAQIGALNPDFVGFIFYELSPRYVGALPVELLEELPKSTKRVGVFVNERQEAIEKLIKTYSLDYVQLHGTESPEMCQSLQKICGVIKSISIANADDLTHATKPYETCVDYLLFDTKTPQHGGSGESFDWQLLQHYKGATPFFLSGGIGPRHTSQIREISHPKLFALDLNSRFETAPGIKDVKQLKTFIDEQN